MNAKQEALMRVLLAAEGGDDRAGAVRLPWAVLPALLAGQWQHFGLIALAQGHDTAVTFDKREKVLWCLEVHT